MARTYYDISASQAEMYIRHEMRTWENNNLERVATDLAQRCGCVKGKISYEYIDPSFKSDKNPGFYFMGPSGNVIARISWDRVSGISTNFGYSSKAIQREVEIIRQQRLERARRKSVNANLEEKKQRETSFEKGLKDLKRFVTRNMREVVMTAAVVSMLIAGSISMNSLKNDILNPEYANPSFDYGRQVVSMETHRTSGNDGYWYDYDDMAARYKEGTDFDSFVYGAYGRLGWNNTSKINAMNKLFSELKYRGITEYGSFVDYCNDLGVCKEVDGELVVNMRAYSNLIEERLTDMNEQEQQRKPGM